MRRLLAAALAAACAALMVAACVGWWVSRTALDTPRFVAVAGPVIDQPPVQTSLSTAIAGELTSLVGLPQLTGLVRREVASVVAGPTFRGVWYASVTVAHRDIVQALTGPTGPTAAVTGSGGTVSVDVIDVVGQVFAVSDEGSTLCDMNFFKPKIGCVKDALHINISRKQLRIRAP